MQELKANMAVLAKEATAALAAVESQQHRLAFQRLVAMMVTEKQHKESAPPAIPTENSSEKTSYFLAEVIHPFSAASKKELHLDKGDYVVVRKVSQTGWAEGECKG
ncbi:unnamed protein product [Microthlaspi erraticum]|uniref:SH3 domain-containing protein n=1 Tax=Microthlaspi erraticum TaxID=1685480 RepID=A0A6D2I4A6_9BRAS|nr:unnamed protein product [Microthlaspi erraticum]CAA7025905.1 unnamed protein product [Microthlaspi erraticum]